MIKPLAEGYRVEVDALKPECWFSLVRQFADGNLYQVWHESGVRRGMAGVSRFVLYRGSDPVAAAEVRLFQLPVINRGIAYVLWGPIWKRRDNSVSREVFQQAIRGLRNEYVSRHKMILRINPRLCIERNATELEILAEEGLAPVDTAPTKRTLLVSLSPELDDIRRSLDKKWRNCLSKAERMGLTIDAGTDLEHFDEFIRLYERLLERKQFAPSADIQKHRRLQEVVPNDLKMRVVLARQQDETCAGAIVSAIGDTGVYLFGATSETGMRVSASYLVQWEAVKTLKLHGLKYYDLNGIDPVLNPGVYHFKRGLGGRQGLEITSIGPHQAARRSISSYVLLLADRLRQHRRLGSFASGQSGA